MEIPSGLESLKHYWIINGAATMLMLIETTTRHG